MKSISINSRIIEYVPAPNFVNFINMSWNPQIVRPSNRLLQDEAVDMYLQVKSDEIEDTIISYYPDLTSDRTERVSLIDTNEVFRAYIELFVRFVGRMPDYKSDRMAKHLGLTVPGREILIRYGLLPESEAELDFISTKKAVSMFLAAGKKIRTFDVANNRYTVKH